jgi:glycerol-3-phosphate acyltransferase PlsY
MIWQKAVAILIGYGFGLFQTAFIIGKLNHIDIRDYGSGNSGTTNAMRTLGKKSGFITYFGDMFKAVLALLATYFLFSKSCDGHQFLIALYTGFGVILGHNFPFYMNFRGGKGIAAFSGLVVGLLIFDWKFFAFGFVIFFGTLFITKYVSLSSLVLMFCFFIEMIVFGQLKMIHGLHDTDRPEAYILAFILMALSFIRHRENIKRLLSGTERRIGSKKEEKNE